MNNWRKFSNSVLLRLAMRISESNPTLSQDAANTAIDNGVMSQILIMLNLLSIFTT